MPLPSSPAADGIQRGMLLREVMNHAGLSIAGVAASIGSTSATVSAWINGGRSAAGYDMTKAKSGVAELLAALLLDATGWNEEELSTSFGVKMTTGRPRRPRQTLEGGTGQVSAFPTFLVRSGYPEGLVCSTRKMVVEYDPDGKDGAVVAEGYGDRLRIDFEVDITSGWRVLGKVVSFRFA